jgi:hypothetical protein
MRIVWVFTFLVLSVSLHAQKFASELWHDGKIVLDSGDTIRGNIMYNMQNDLLQFEKNGQLASYSARKVQFFEIFDVTVKQYRQFYSLPYATSGAYKAPVFFELLSEGNMTLLCRESIEYKTTSMSYYYMGTSTRLVLVNKYFLLNEKGKIEPFTGRRSDLIYLMGNKGVVVEKYAKENKLGIERKYEFVQIVNYYNSLF